MRLLIRSSVSAGYFPVYAFYTPLTEPCRVPFNHVEGVFLASGFDIFHRFYRKGLLVTPADLMSRSFPLSYVLCFALVQASRSPSGPGPWLFEEPLKPKVTIGGTPVPTPDKIGFESGMHPLAREARLVEEESVEHFDDTPVKEYFANHPGVTRVAVLDARGLEDSGGPPVET